MMRTHTLANARIAHELRNVYDVPSSSPQLSKFIGIAEVCRREADEEKTARGRKSALSRNQAPPFRSLLLPLRQKCPAVDAMARQRLSRGECLPRPVSSDYQRGSCRRFHDERGVERRSKATASCWMCFK